MFVLDCSVTMNWCFADESANNKYAAFVLDYMQKNEALVPRLWHLEVLNVLLVAERQRRITAKQSNTFLGFLASAGIKTDAMPVTIHDDDTLALARKYQLSSYDAAYLALAIGEDILLATQDKGLRAAANALGVWLEH